MWRQGQGFFFERILIKLLKYVECWHRFSLYDMSVKNWHQTPRVSSCFTLLNRVWHWRTPILLEVYSWKWTTTSLNVSLSTWYITLRFCFLKGSSHNYLVLEIIVLNALYSFFFISKRGIEIVSYLKPKKCYHMRISEIRSLAYWVFIQGISPQKFRYGQKIFEKTR